VTADVVPCASRDLAELLVGDGLGDGAGRVVDASEGRIEASVRTAITDRATDFADGGLLLTADPVLALLGPPPPVAAGVATEGGLAVRVKGQTVGFFEDSRLAVGTRARAALDRKTAIPVPVPLRALVADDVGTEGDFDARGITGTDGGIGRKRGISSDGGVPRVDRGVARGIANRSVLTGASV
jgi:hypothetical protein